MLKRLLIYGLFAVAVVLAVVRISNAYVDLQVSEMRKSARVVKPSAQVPQEPAPQPHQAPVCPVGDPCRQRIVNYI